MLQIIVVINEAFDEKTSEFIDAETIVLDLEHSLVSLSKWESKWEIPFLASKDKTNAWTDDQTLDYIKMMNLRAEFPTELFTHFSAENFNAIDEYINARMSASRIPKQHNLPTGEVVTAELIYYWMIALSIPFECQTWHLNRLLKLIEVCNVKNAPPKKMGRGELAQRNRELNEQRRKETGSKG